MINLPLTTAMMIIISATFPERWYFLRLFLRQDISSTGVISRAGVVPEGLGVGEASCLGTISMGICKAGPSCLKADSLLTQVFFLLFKRIFSRNFLCYFKSIQSSTC